MFKVGITLAGVLALPVGCDDDDDIADGQIGGEVAPDAPMDIGTSFQVVLTPAEGVPVCAAAGSYATGAATVIVSADRAIVEVGGLRIGELSSAASMAHIHVGPAGVAGPIVLDLSRILTSPTTITFSRSSYPSPVPAGVPANLAAFIDQMFAGNTYINVHTTLCPSGELRGQIR